MGTFWQRVGAIIKKGALSEDKTPSHSTYQVLSTQGITFEKVLNYSGLLASHSFSILLRAVNMPFATYTQRPPTRMTKIIAEAGISKCGPARKIDTSKNKHTIAHEIKLIVLAIFFLFFPE